MPQAGRRPAGGPEGRPIYNVGPNVKGGTGRVLPGRARERFAEVILIAFPTHVVQNSSSCYYGGQATNHLFDLKLQAMIRSPNSPLYCAGRQAAHSHRRP